MEEDKSDEDELRKAIEMSLQKESKEDVTMVPQNQNVEIRAFDVTLDLIKYFKNEIVRNCRKDDVLNADLMVYLLCKSIKVYGKYRTSLSNEAFDQIICDYLIEIIDSCITSVDNESMLKKTKQCETVYIMIEVINSLISFSDKQPVSFAKGSKKDDKGTKQDKGNSKDPPKARMRTHLIFKLIERMKARQKSTEDEPKLILWLTATTQMFISYFSEDRGSITISNSFDKTIGMIIWYLKCIV